MKNELLHGILLYILLVLGIFRIGGSPWPSGYLCLGSTPTSGKAVDLSQYDPGC